MLYLVDGSNVMGMFGGLRDEGARRQLVTRLAAFAREKKSRVICFFDGPPPHGLANRLGSLEVRFTPGTSADDAIAKVVREQRIPVTVVTGDLGLYARIQGRHVHRMNPLALRVAEQAGTSSDDANWEEYFSDPKNRNI